MKMRNILPGLTLAVFVSSAAFAQNTLTISQLATDNATRNEFHNMIANQHLPTWVTRGGTDSAVEKVVINGEHYLVLTSCKPHDCASQRIAVLYAPATKKMAGVFSVTDERGNGEKLQWLNVPDDLSIDGKTILFAALTGSLDNHPDGFNFSD